MYAIVGNGTVGLKEAIKSIDSLWEAAEQRGEDFWIAAISGSYENPVVEGLLDWANKQGLYTYGIYARGDDLREPEPKRFSEVAVVDDPWETIEEFVSGSKNDGLLAIIPEDSTELLFEDTQLINRLISGGTRVFDLAAQMSEVTLEADEPSEPREPSEVEESAPEGLHETPLVPPASFALTYEDYDALSLAELKGQVTNLGLEIEGDKRAKDPYIKALMSHLAGDAQPGSTDPEPVNDEDVPQVAAEAPTEPQDAPRETEWKSDPEAYGEAVEAFSSDVQGSVIEDDDLPTSDVITIASPPRYVITVTRNTTYQVEVAASEFSDATKKATELLASVAEGYEEPFTDTMTVSTHRL